MLGNKHINIKRLELGPVKSIIFILDAQTI